MLLKVGQPSRELSLQTLRQQKKVNEEGMFQPYVDIFFLSAHKMQLQFFSKIVTMLGVKSNEGPVILASHSSLDEGQCLR